MHTRVVSFQNKSSRGSRVRKCHMYMSLLVKTIVREKRSRRLCGHLSNHMTTSRKLPWELGEPQGGLRTIPRGTDPIDDRIEDKILYFFCCWKYEIVWGKGTRVWCHIRITPPGPSEVHPEGQRSLGGIATSPRTFRMVYGARQRRCRPSIDAKVRSSLAPGNIITAFS